MVYGASLENLWSKGLRGSNPLPSAMNCEHAKTALEEAQQAALAEIDVTKTVGCGYPNCSVLLIAISHKKGFVSGQHSGDLCILGNKLPSNSKSPNFHDASTF